MLSIQRKSLFTSLCFHKSEYNTNYHIQIVLTFIKTWQKHIVIGNSLKHLIKQACNRLCEVSYYFGFDSIPELQPVIVEYTIQCYR